MSDGTPASPPVDLTGQYLTTDELRDETGEAIQEADAAKIVADACDWIDAQLGNRETDPTTGRKVIESEVQPWQWTKLKRAALKVAVKLFADPTALTAAQWSTIKGPDFETSGRLSVSADTFGSDVSAILDQSGLRVLTAVWGVGRNQPPWYDFSNSVDYD